MTDLSGPRKPFFYANAAAAGFSPYDVTVVFQRRGIDAGKSFPAGDTRESDILAELDVVMSPAQAKAVAAVLVSTILEYETMHGRISVSDAQLLDLASKLVRTKQ